jgi:hypothetical protein
MFLRAKTRTKDGKTHRYWNVVENRRVGRRVIQRDLLYLGELNDVQRSGWVRTIEVIDRGGPSKRAAMPRQLALFPDERPAPAEPACEAVHVRLDQIKPHQPRQWGACWLAMHLWETLQLDRFWAPRLAPSRKGTRRLTKFMPATRTIRIRWRSFRGGSRRATARPGARG